MTELGPLAEGWEAASLESVVSKAFGGGTPSTKRPEFWGGRILWTTSAQINGIHLSRAPKTITDEGLRRSSSSVVPRGHLLVGTRVGVGKVAIPDFDVAISQDLTGLVLETERITSDFAAYVLSSKPLQEQFRLSPRGSTIKGVPREDLLRFRLPLPSLPEQREIAAVLNAVADSEEQERNRKSALETLFRTMLYLLMTGQVRVYDWDIAEAGEGGARWPSG